MPPSTTRATTLACVSNVIPRLLALAVLCGASVIAVAATPVALAPAPDFAGRGSGSSLERGVRRALETARVPLVSPALAAGRARAAHVAWGHGMSPAQAGSLAQANHWAGVVIVEGSKRHLGIRLVDAAGETVVTQRLLVSHRRAAPADIEAFARAVSATLASATAAAPPPPPAPAPPPTPPPPPPEQAAPPAESTPTAETEAPESPKETRLQRWDVELGGFAGTHKFDLPGTFSYRTSFPYSGPAIAGAVFPFGAPGSWVEGFGIVAAAQLGIVEAEVSGGSGTFTATDLQASLDLAYQFAPIDRPFGPRLTVRAGGTLRYFDAPASSGVADDDRLAPEVALDLEQPLVPAYLRVTGSFGWLPIANQGQTAQQALGTSSGSGFEWQAGLAGRIFRAFGWEAHVLQQRFADAHPGSVSADDIDTSYDLLLTLQR